MSEKGNEMSGEQLIPNAVGRLDDVVEAIREGDRERAKKLLAFELARIMEKKRDYEKHYWAAAKCVDSVEEFANRIGVDDWWNLARRACGWSGVDGVDPAEPGGDFTVEIPLASREQTLKHADAEDEIQGGLTAGCQPALKAETLPIGTVMVLGRIRWTLKGRWPDSTLSEWDRVAGGRDRTYTNDEIQELIDRGVLIIEPKGGPQ